MAFKTVLKKKSERDWGKARTSAVTHRVHGRQQEKDLKRPRALKATLNADLILAGAGLWNLLEELFAIQLFQLGSNTPTQSCEQSGAQHTLLELGSAAYSQQLL